MPKKIQTKPLIIITMTFLMLLTVVHADNWVCYDTTGTVTESQLRHAFATKARIQPESPLQIIRTNSISESFTQSSYFTDCGSSRTFQYCPENQYFLKTAFYCAQGCNHFAGSHHQYRNLLPGVDCGLGGGPYCTSFRSVGNCNQATQSFVCGKSNNLWQTMTASSNWICPKCEELSKRQNGVEPQMGDISSFRDLSFGSQFKFSNSKVDLSFMVYILACINRVPMVHLDARLIDKITGQAVNKEVGIYAKHETLDYNEDNLGMLKEFKIPDQDEFKKTYTLQGTLKAYRAWSWRSRLVDGMKKITSQLGLTIPGFPSNYHDLKQGNLYYSPDFLTSKSSLRGASLEGSSTTIASHKGSINVLKNINKQGSSYMCTKQDLENYIKSKGVTNSLLNDIGKVIPLIDGADYDNIIVTDAEDKELEFTKTNIKVTKANIPSYYSDVDDWYNDFKRNSKSKQIVELYNIGVLSKSQLESIARQQVSGWYDYSPDKGCNNFEYEIRNIALLSHTKRTESEFSFFEYYWVDEEYEEIEYIEVRKSREVFNPDTNTTETEYYTELEPQTVTKTKKVKKKKSMFEDVIYLNLELEGIFENNIVANLELEYEKEIDESYSWDFASLADLDSKILAKCLYNWDECMIKEVKSGSNTYKEIADCGMGPPSNLAEPTMKDGARGQKTISQDITIYKKCETGKDWISKYKGYSCVDGKYYRCKFAEDAGDFLLGVTGAGVGDSLVRQGSKGYVCTNEGWKNIDCNP